VGYGSVTRIHRSNPLPIRSGLSWKERWESDDGGLIATWERGREIAAEDGRRAKREDEPPTRSDRALAGELPILPWKGGVEKKLAGRKYGTFKYLAMWQGLRGQDLDIEPSGETTLVCTRTGMSVTYTADITKYSDGDGAK